jgi:hypothetical protein
MLEVGSLVVASLPMTVGRAELTTSSLALGDHPITAHYTGDADHPPSSSATLTHTVEKAATTTAVVSGPNPSAFGQAVTFTATVTSPGAAVPTGAVVFVRNGGETLGAGTLNDAGQATFTTASLTAGSHSITAVYDGDATSMPSTSGVLDQVVEPAATATALDSTPNPSTAGQAVTFTATVTVTSPGAGIAGGVVMFLRDGTETLGTAVLDGTGRAVLATAALTAGQHGITARYAGDANHLGSTSAIVTQAVEAPADVATAVLAPDATDPAETELRVVGTSGDDTIDIVRGSGGALDVRVGGELLARFPIRPTGRVVVRGLGGNDTIRVAGLFPRRSWIYGDDGADTIVTDDGASVLLGGAGDDELRGGGARDILIGGTGADALLGENGDDILIGGATSFDADTAALAAIEAEWNALRPYAERIANLSGATTGGLNGGVNLDAGTVSFDDGPDALAGGRAGDWFFAGPGDTSDARPAEQVVGPAA